MTANRSSAEEVERERERLRLRARERARLRALTPEEYEAEMLDAMRVRTRHGYGGPEIAAKVVEVRLEDSYPETQMIVVLIDPARPDCRFGWAWSIWRGGLLPLIPFDGAANKELGMDTWVNQAWDRFRALPCEPGELTWVAPPGRHLERTPEVIATEQLIYNEDRRERPGDSDWRPETWGPIDVPPATLPPDRPGLG